MEKKYFSQEVQVCGNCKGEGRCYFPANNPHNGDEEGHENVCYMCQGSGLVQVNKQTIVTIMPKVIVHD